MIRKYKNILITANNNDLIVSKTMLSLMDNFNVFNIGNYIKKEHPKLLVSDYQWHIDYDFPFLVDEIKTTDNYLFDDALHENDISKNEIEHLSLYEIVLSEYLVLHFQNKDDIRVMKQLITDKYFKLDEKLTVFYKQVRLLEKNKKNNLILHKDLSKEYVVYLEKELFDITKASDLIELREELYKIMNYLDSSLREYNYGYLLFKEKHKDDLRSIRKYYNVLNNVYEKHLSFLIFENLTNLLTENDGKKAFEEYFNFK